jgi:hypothetical protein
MLLVVKRHRYNQSLGDMTHMIGMEKPEASS